MVAGGAEIYALALPRAGRIQITEVDTAPDGDARFPGVPPDFREVAAEAHPADRRTSMPYGSRRSSENARERNARERHVLRLRGHLNSAVRRW